jgi:hypothetical protein
MGAANQFFTASCTKYIGPDMKEVSNTLIMQRNAKRLRALRSSVRPCPP